MYPEYTLNVPVSTKAHQCHPSFASPLTRPPRPPLAPPPSRQVCAAVEPWCVPRGGQLCVRHRPHAARTGRQARGKALNAYHRTCSLLPESSSARSDFSTTSMF
eukprot:1195570-Prorocentrum_minimum.AAC.4